MRTLIVTVILLAVLCIPNISFAAGDPGWPRVYEKGGQKLVLYQPQVDEWKDYSAISFRAAFSAIQNAKDAPRYGVVEGKADTTTDSAARIVTLRNLKLDVRFSGAQGGNPQNLESVVRDLFPVQQSLDVSLDRVIAYLDPSKGVQHDVKVSLDPPMIFFSETPAVLVSFIGQPKFKPIANSDLSVAINTNWDVFLDRTDAKYYLLLGESWLRSSDPVKGTWQSVRVLPGSFSTLPHSDDWSDVRKKIPGKPLSKTTQVLTSTTPAELILTKGEPTYAPISDTKLMYVSNTESPLFRHEIDKQYYFLVAGRWFKAPSPQGPWSAATKELPADFAKIPRYSKMAYVLSSVPGTNEAADAVLLASIPQQTTINRSDAKFEVSYEGEPKFTDISSAQVKYARNTSSDVFLVNGTYYACSQGIWFTGTTPHGPWTVADSVPQEIYSIPVDSPKHNVTYVHVYESSPDTVTTGYTGGYSGEYVSSGSLMFGAGYALGDTINDDDDDDYYYPPLPFFYSYGGGTRYDYGDGRYVRVATAYGPFGGVGRSAGYYNPSTGGYARTASAVGPGGAAITRDAYNPFTDTRAGRAATVTPYGSASRGYVSQDDDWARGGQRVTSAGRVGWAATSNGAKVVGYNVKGPGGAGYVVKESSGDLYAGRNGSVYRPDSEGGWSTFEGDKWSAVERPTQHSIDTDTAARARANVAQESGSGQDARASSSNRQSNGNYSGIFEHNESTDRLNSDMQARSRGNELSNRSQSWQSSGNVSRPSAGHSGGSSVSRPSSGFSRGGGGGRRR